jgi:hypothetical protein
LKSSDAFLRNIYGFEIWQRNIVLAEKDEQSQLHDIMPCFTLVVVEFVFIEEEFQAFMAYT